MLAEINNYRVTDYKSATTGYKSATTGAFTSKQIIETIKNELQVRDNGLGIMSTTPENSGATPSEIQQILETVPLDPRP